MLSVVVLCCFLASTSAWLPPERCAQEPAPSRTRRSTDEPTIVPTVTNIETAVTKQKDYLKESYEDYKFYGSTVSELQVTEDGKIYAMKVPHNCSFLTYNPKLIPGTSYSCDTPNCKLIRTVSTEQSYTASEGYEWGTKFSASFGVENVFEIGGEVSITGTYSCAYTKAKTVTTAIECIAPKPGLLGMYLINSDLNCDYGKVTLEAEKRGEYDNQIIHLSNDELEQVVFNVKAKFYNDERDDLWAMVDLDKISKDLRNKILSQVPLLNPYTDLFLVKKIDKNEYSSVVYYFKQTSEESAGKIIVPFTDENGNAVYSYHCKFTEL